MPSAAAGALAEPASSSVLSPGSPRERIVSVITPRSRFAQLLKGPRCDLARGALEIARIAYPGLDPAPSLVELDRLANVVRPRLMPGFSPADRALTVARFLFGECGFRGNSDDYYDTRNSFLNDVLERRMGIPITLSTVLLEVGARVGVPFEGVGFPGHFLVRVPAGAGEVLYLERDADAEALLAVDLLLVLAPRGADEVRTRGFLYERLGCPAAAADDFRRYLELAPEAEDVQQIQLRLSRLLDDAPTLH